MKILIIGQLPKEIGGNYTTGAANVVFELSKQHPDGVKYYTYGTNITAEAAEKSSSYANQYIGYKMKPIRMLLRAFAHPMVTYRHLKHYRSVDHQNMFRFFFYEDNIREAIKIVQPDLVHVNSINNVSPVHFAVGDLKIPMLLTCHGIFYRGDTEDKELRDSYSGNIAFADAYSGLTNESLDEYEKNLGVKRELVTVIPNGVDCKKFYFSPEARASIRNEYGVADYCKVFITVASLQERKGQLAFIKILERLKLDYQYWIIGKGPDELKIEEYIQEHKLTDKVKLIGYVAADRLYKYYSASDIYAHPSWKEGQALSELEANATGLRTILNKSVVDTIAGDMSSDDYFVLDFGSIDVDTIAEWVKLENVERKSRTNFDWKVIADMYAELYKRILNSK